MGRRVEKTVLNRSGDAWLPESSILFVYNGYKLVEELDGLSDAKPPLRRYTWQPESLGLDVPLSVFDVAANATYFYTIDANKNVSDLTDANGNVVAHYEYSPFGVPTLAAGTYAAANPFRFSSEYHDSETNLVYYNYRYYSPALGRWLSRDPIGEKGGNNLYRIVSNSPINYWDRLGLQSLPPDDPEAEYRRTLRESAIAASGMAEGFLGSLWDGFLAGLFGAGNAMKRLILPAASSMLNSECPTVPESQNQESQNQDSDNDGSTESDNSSTGESEQKPIKPPYHGEPNSTIEGQKQSRRYDKDGNPEVDVDTGHDHGAGNDHAHDWTNGVRGPGRPVQSGDPPVPKGYGK